MKKSIVCLTRGYTNYQFYHKLIRRNKQIETYLIDKEMDILIFHEGNIHHQNEIQQETPSLRLKFIDVKKDGFAFNSEREHVTVDIDTIGFTMGYRHMCSFWFVDFWKFVEEYDCILRIDEDCFIEFVPDKVFDSMQTCPIISGRCEDDCEFVTRGLNDHSLKFMLENDNVANSRTPSGPYTNLIGFNLVYLRGIPLLHKFIESIKVSNKIYQQRWGDLPLWGEAIHYILGESKLRVDSTLKYFHESHHLYVNT